MAFDRTKPADTDYISSSAANLRENFRALAEDTRLYGTGAPESSAGQNGWRYKDTNNGKEYIKINGAWIEKYSRPSLPIGSVIAVPVNDVPDHFLECNGATISRETYPELFSAIGTTYGAGDESTTFQLPDLRGEFIRGWDNTRGIDAEREIGSAQADAFKSHRHSIPGIYPGILGASGYIPYAGQTGTMSAIDTATTGGTETRPRNVAMMFCIVYE